MSERERRVLLAGAGLVALSVFGLRIAPEFARRVRWLEEDLAAKRVLVERSRATLAGRSQLSDSIAWLAGSVPRALSSALPVHQVETAVRDLVARVTVALTRNEARLERIQPQRDSLQVARLRRVSARAVFEADARGMTAVLTDLARDSAISVDRVQVEREVDLAQREERTNAVDAPERLRVVIDLHAWFVADSIRPVFTGPPWAGRDSSGAGDQR